MIYNDPSRESPNINNVVNYDVVVAMLLTFVVVRVQSFNSIIVCYSFNITKM